VWQAHDTQLEVDVAIKEVVLPAVLAEEEQMALPVLFIVRDILTRRAESVRRAVPAP